jgi:predicted RND superfamily exporter protein
MLTLLLLQTSTTTGKMLQTAFGAAGIALGFSGIVVLVSSRSFMLTLFSIVTIGYVLTATTALLVAAGWTLGFLESVCFAILIGISCDFVIHFGHSYASLPGVISRHERTKFALIRMGPSILAAAFTTVCAAVIMLFTVISFFQQFAQILFFTVIQATAGTFIFFLTLTDCLGPSEPTVLYDKMLAKCCGCGKKNATAEEYSSGEAPPAVADTPAKEGSSLGTTEKLLEESIVN